MRRGKGFDMAIRESKRLQVARKMKDRYEARKRLADMRTELLANAECLVQFNDPALQAFSRQVIEYLEAEP